MQICDFFNGNFKRRRQKSKEAEAMLKLKRLSHGAPLGEVGNGTVVTLGGGIGVIGRHGEKIMVPEVDDSYMTNPNLTISVPIAPGESDVEFPEEDDDDDEDESEISEEDEEEEEEEESKQVGWVGGSIWYRYWKVYNNNSCIFVILQAIQILLSPHKLGFHPIGE